MRILCALVSRACSDDRPLALGGTPPRRHILMLITGIMIRPRRILTALAVVASLGASVAIAIPLSTLLALNRGRWQLKEIGTGAAARSVCAVEPFQLIQLNHPGGPCTHFTIEDTAEHVTIHYNCHSRGYGRTTITLESAGLIRLDTQGIAPDGQPFDSSYEGSFAGDCRPSLRR